MVEYEGHDEKSYPRPRPIKSFRELEKSGCSRLPRTEEIKGSNPLFPTKFISENRGVWLIPLALEARARWFESNFSDQVPNRADLSVGKTLGAEHLGPVSRQRVHRLLFGRPKIFYWGVGKLAIRSAVNGDIGGSSPPAPAKFLRR